VPTKKGILLLQFLLLKIPGSHPSLPRPRRPPPGDCPSPCRAPVASFISYHKLASLMSLPEANFSCSVTLNRVLYTTKKEWNGRRILTITFGFWHLNSNRTQRESNGKFLSI
jgi:hypothetical protein